VAMLHMIIVIYRVC